MNSLSTDDLPDAVGERHVLQPQEELRVEIPFGSQEITVCLQKGSCELWGCELAVGKSYSIANGGVKLALFTWHGGVVDIDSPNLELSYTSDETDANVAYVNTHAQLEAMRDEAAASGTTGPRVMIVGPTESGKTSLCKTLIAYACKVGRTPLWVDLDPCDNSLSVPGTLSVAPMTAAAVTFETYATSGIPPSTVHPLVTWHGSSTKMHPEVFGPQVEKMAETIQMRLQNDENARSSGMVVNTNGWIEEGGYQLLLQATKALDINVLLIMGHDRVYSMMVNHYKQLQKQGPQTDLTIPKILKLPRSGGVVSRPQPFIRSSRSRAVKRYFYGDLVDPPKTATSSSDGTSTTAAASSGTAGSKKDTAKVPQLTPFLLQLPFSELKIYKLTNMALSSSLLPVAQQQSTDAIQLTLVDFETDSPEALQHALLAVCHPAAVAAYQQSGKARDLVTAGIAGVCAVERVFKDTDMMHLLSPCAGSLPSKTLLWGDVTWME